MGEYKTFIGNIRTSDFGGFNSIEYANGGLETYLSFQALLKWVGEYVNLFSEGEEVLKVDWESDKPMFMYSTSISCNLQKCYIKNSYLRTTSGTFNTFSKADIGPFNSIQRFADRKYTTLNEALKKEAGVVRDISIYPTLGNINYIYLNVAYLSKVLLENTGKADNKITVRQYLQDICDGVSKALGSINDLQVISDVDSGVEVLTIIDYEQKRIKGLTNTSENITTFKAQGLGSMLTSISAQSSITPDLATMISVGAQAQGQTVGEEAISFSILSSGLKDSIYPTKQIGKEKQEVIDNTKAENATKRRDQIQSDYRTALGVYLKLINNQTPVDGSIFSPVNLGQSDDANQENTAVELYKACLARFTETGQTSTAFIPIKLDFTLLGLGGMKIFQKFRITNDVLPLSYKDTYEFIITGLSHTVNASKWETSISAVITIPEKKVQTVENALKPFSVFVEELAPPSTFSGVLAIRSAKTSIKCNTITKNVTKFEEVLALVIDNLEGAYSKGGLDAGSANSGETLWGLDRKNHTGTYDTAFWQLVDREDKSRWNNNTYPKPKDKPVLYDSYKTIIKADYDSFKKLYLKNTEIANLIESDGRLYFNMIYAVYNGQGWFKGFSKVLEDAYLSGKTTSDALVEEIVNERVAGGATAFRNIGGNNLNTVSATLIANTGVDIEKMVGMGPDCEVVQAVVTANTTYIPTTYGIRQNPEYKGPVR